MAQRNHKCHICAVASNTVENKYVLKCALKVVSDIAQCHVDWTAARSMLVDRQPRRIDRRKCCSDVAQCRHIARWTAGISAQNRQPADSSRQGNPAPSPTVHGRRDSPACTGYVATQVASAGVMCSHRRVPVTRRAAAFCADCRRRENCSSPGNWKWTRGLLP